MKKLLFILSLTILTACGGSDSVDEPLINPIDEISGEYLLDRFVANSNTQSMCTSFLSISEEQFRLELNYQDSSTGIPTDCLPPNIRDYENIYVEGNEIRKSSDDYVINKFVIVNNELILFLSNADDYLTSSQRFYFIKQ
ncbi:hypothetical protein N9254_02070 [Flavobacteriaceae bacterium]|nr:hypothetical protein [Flavobacteriaceae bacterium]